MHLKQMLHHSSTQNQWQLVMENQHSRKHQLLLMTKEHKGNRVPAMWSTSHQTSSQVRASLAWSPTLHQTFLI
jgi:hypothetical protein